jgi:SET domain
MYKQYLKSQPSKSGNHGTFSTVKIPAGSPIIEMAGPVILDRDITATDYSMYLQVGPNTFIGLSGGVDDYINHSCDPNCYVHVVGNRAILYSLYVIPEGAELTFDYSTTSTDTMATWKMECKCGSNKCRKVISGFQYLDPVLQETYKKKNIVPLYILQPTTIQKR